MKIIFTIAIIGLIVYLWRTADSLYGGPLQDIGNSLLALGVIIIVIIISFNI